jgi:uncharacterized membrane protein YbjE (DUF340 family)
MLFGLKTTPMRDSLLIVLCFVAGLLLSHFGGLPDALLHQNISTYILYVLMFIVGVGIGADLAAFKTLKQYNLKLLLVPGAVVVGSLAGGALSGLLLPGLTARESMAVGAGFGYYSLSSVLISQMHSDTLATLALLSNVLREILTLLLAPVMATLFGQLAPIAAGGATAMDTTLPVIVRVSGSHYALIALFSGTVLTVLVPFLVTFILSV